MAGLGNPGPAYARTRHNAGFWFVDELARRHAGVFRLEPRHQAELARVRIGTADVRLVKPMSFMNRSGTPLASVAGFYKVPPGEILVACDELDFPPGIARLKLGGSHAGHNGIRDIMAHLGDAFWRVRIGVGHPASAHEVIDYVLARPPAADERAILESIEAAADAVPVLLEQGEQKAMHRLHSRNTAVREGD